MINLIIAELNMLYINFNYKLSFYIFFHWFEFEQITFVSFPLYDFLSEF